MCLIRSGVCQKISGGCAKFRALFLPVLFVANTSLIHLPKKIKHFVLESPLLNSKSLGSLKIIVKKEFGG